MSDYMIVLPRTLPGPSTPGKWANIWAAQVSVVERFIKENSDKLQKWQQAQESQMAPESVEPRATGSKRPALVWYNPYGGMKLAHLHYAGDIYVLTESQWADFSKSVMMSFTDKLRSAGKVTFDQVMNISEAVAGL